jgi:hypothetical protein
MAIKEKMKGILQSTWVLTFIPVVVLLLNILVSATQNAFGGITVVVSLLFLAFIFAGNMFVYDKILKQLLSEHVLQKFEVNLGRQLAEWPSLPENLIMQDSKLAEYEKICRCDEIWVLSNDLKTEVDGGLYAAIVPANLARGIKYKFFVAKTSGTDIRIEQLKKRNGYPDLAKYYRVGEDFFFLVAKFDVCIFDPYKTAASGRKGYIGLDISADHHELDVVEISDGLVDAIESKLLEYIPDEEQQ